MSAPAVSPSAMTRRATNTTTSGGRLMRVRAERTRPSSPVSMTRRRHQPFRNLGPAGRATRFKTGSYRVVGSVAIVAEGRGAHSAGRRHGWADSAAGGAMTRVVARGARAGRGRASAGVGGAPRAETETEHAHELDRRRGPVSAAM